MPGADGHLFPRSAERGSIEAASRKRTVLSGSRSFHVRLSVAPLKPGYGFAEFQRRRMFPRSAERGSIEAITPAGAIAKTVQSFHVRLSVAPLKRPAGAPATPTYRSPVSTFG